jgi:type IV pilus assembly protein PilV
MRPVNNHGFTLLEVLIALVVLSVGLLGLAALQTGTLRFNQAAYLRSQATNLAYDIADRIRANRTAALAAGYDGANAYLAANALPACAAPAGAGTVAQNDIEAWRIALVCTLPVGNGRIVRAGSLLTVSIQWDETRGPADDLEEFTMVTSL